MLRKLHRDKSLRNTEAFIFRGFFFILFNNLLSADKHRVNAEVICFFVSLSLSVCV